MVLTGGWWPPNLPAQKNSWFSPLFHLNRQAGFTLFSSKFLVSPSFCLFFSEVQLSLGHSLFSRTSMYLPPSPPRGRSFVLQVSPYYAWTKKIPSLFTLALLSIALYLNGILSYFSLLPTQKLPLSRFPRGP